MLNMKNTDRHFLSLTEEEAAFFALPMQENIIVTEMSAYEKVEKVRKTYLVPTTLAAELDTYCKQNGATRTDVVTKALQQFLQQSK